MLKKDKEYGKKLIMEESILKKMVKKPEEKKPAPKGLSRIDALRDQDEEVKKLPEEDYENKKLVPILRQAFDLHMKIIKKKEEADKEIKRIQNNKKKLHKESQNYEKYKKAQV